MDAPRAFESGRAPNKGTAAFGSGVLGALRVAKNLGVSEGLGPGSSASSSEESKTMTLRKPRLLILDSGEERRRVIELLAAPLSARE